MTKPALEFILKSMSEDAKLVLIVEDEEPLRNLYQKEFLKQGFRVEVAVDGEEGLLKAGVKKPDLIVLDIMLPKMSGLDVLKSLKNNALTKVIPVTLLTNLGDEQIIKDAFKLGADGYFLKVSYTPSQVVEECKKFLQ